MANVKNQKAVVVKKAKVEMTRAVGRRKEAVARVRLIPNGKGMITVNGKPAEEYFGKGAALARLTHPLRLTNMATRFDVTVRVVGGGLSGQLGAVIHGLSRTLVTLDKEAHRPVLKSAGLLTRDPRAKERRKAGFAGKARAKKSSPKR